VSAGQQVLTVTELENVVTLHHYAKRVTSGPDARLDEVAIRSLLPVAMEVKSLPDHAFIRNSGENCDWLFFKYSNAKDIKERIFFYLGSYTDITVYRHDSITGLTDSLQMEDFFRQNGSFIFPLDFPGSSTTNICFRIGMGNRPNHPMLFHYVGIDAVDIRERLYADLMSSDEKLFLKTPVVLLFMGMIIGIMFFAAFHYFQTREIVFVYYFLYLLFILLFMGTRLAEVGSAHVIWYHLGYFRDVTWQPLSYLFYFLFSMHFVDFRKYRPGIHRLLKMLVYLLLLYIAIDMTFAATGKLAWRRDLYLYWRIAMIPVALFLISGTLMISDRFARILATGSLCMAGGAIAAFCIALFSDDYDTDWFRYQMEIMYAGIVAELLFFTSGLSLKTKKIAGEKAALAVQLELEKELKEIEKRQTIIDVQQKERERFAQDLHDDLGSGLTSIRFLSEAISRNPGDRGSVEKINDLADEMNRSMRQIVWAMQSGQRTVPELSRFIKAQANDLFEMNGISFNCRLDERLPEFPLTAFQVRNIGLTVKEAGNNILKHAQATRVDMEVCMVEGRYTIRISDNGIGIPDKDSLTHNRGLENMKQRMIAIGGTVEVNSYSEGTRVKLSLPISANIGDDR